MLTALLHVDGAEKRYRGKTAVAGVSLELNRGEVVCLLGPNGAGKTTTLKMILGLETPTSGRVSVAGVDVGSDPGAARRRLAYIPERVSLHEAFTALENLAYFASLVGGSDLTAGHLESCLERAGLQREAWERPLSGYSKGMRQKVGVAIALAKRAELLVLDEPTSGLDPKSASEFTNLIREIAGGGAGVIMATHDLFRAKDVATRIHILKDGSIVRTLDPSDLTYSDVEAAYLGVFGGEV